MSTQGSRHLIDPRGQRFGAALSAILLVCAYLVAVPLVIALVAAALAVSALYGTRYSALGRPWPVVRDVLHLGPPREREPEFGPRFAQAIGALVLVAGLVLMAAMPGIAGWSLVGVVVVLQTLLAVTGYCLGCRLYGLGWWVPQQFDRYVFRRS